MTADYWDRLIAMHQTAADNPAFSPDVRSANLNYVFRLRLHKYADMDFCEAQDMVLDQEDAQCLN